MAKEPTNYPSDAADKYVLRFPDGMRDRLKQAAAANNRTLNAEIVKRLEESFVAVAVDPHMSGQLDLLVQLRRTELQSVISSLESKMTQLFIEGRELLQRQKDGEIGVSDFTKGIDEIRKRKESLNADLSAALAELLRFSPTPSPNAGKPKG